MTLDRFLELAEAALPDGADRNLQPYRDEYSPYMHAERPMQPTPSGSVLVDELYGLVYDYIPEAGSGIYGITGEMPSADLDDKADMGFLRIPFERIPRCRVGNLHELQSLIERIPRRVKNSRFLFRGQTQEHFIGRSPQTLEVLYADPDALEPSLLPSGVRRGFDLDAVLQEWTAVLDWALVSWIGKLDGGQREVIFKQFINFRDHYLFRRFSAAVAQHYGLPSAGLDVTRDLRIALFFALRKLVPTQTKGVLKCVPVDAREGSLPVLYVFEPYPERVQDGFDRETPHWLPLTRPQRQAAHFLHCGWGLSQNASARWLVAAFYLDPKGDFGALPSAEELFPRLEVDFFGQIIAMLQQTDLHLILPELGRFISYFYTLQPEDQ